ncbi:LysM peptidoglycan-binding domain-containing protein [uncultured Leifsonia sp.]|uniref:LysM peptidoglycan-binding domain-containing protein n=1 Tax=uncultured Leifsonia sp. TaxID=340359 RepID=UPI0028D2553C|nr:LysM peptidoglycan-binding domain-containing protein [uncultured Leifsonia sp.]
MALIESAAGGADDRARKRRVGILGTVPIAVAGSIAVTLGLVSPAQAAAPADAERAKEKPQQPTGPQDTITSSIPTGSRTSEAQTSVAAAPASYTVRSGDTVSGIAARFGLSTASVLARNGLSWKSLIFPGQVLALGGGSAAAPSRPSAPAAPAPNAVGAKYKVVSGDTISGIAARFGVSTKAVLSANGLSSSSLIFPGQLVTIPGMATASVSTPIASHAAVAPAPAPAVSVQPGRVVALTDEMRANAALIIRIGREQGVPDQGIVVALAAAAQESGLRNVRYGDRDSLGLFQQRPSTGWGTPAQVLDPVRATKAFYGGSGNPNAGRTRGLLDIPGWSRMSVAQAAQAVQISAFPTAYAKWETSARAWLAQLG